MFIVHHNACRPFTFSQDGFQREHLQMEMWVDISFAEVVVDVGGSATVICY